MGLPSLPSGWSYRCVSSADLRKINGSGWIPVDFTQFPGGSPLRALPIDPVNNTSYYYSYVAGSSWALSALMESEKMAKERGNKDSGFNPGKYEVGSNLRLIAQSEGLVGWWSFDEGSGTVARDLSGNNNNGTLVNGPTWTSGKVGAALSFDGVDDYVNVPHSPSLNAPTQYTISAWVFGTFVKPDTNPWNNVAVKLIPDNYGLWVSKDRFLHHCAVIAGVRQCTNSNPGIIPQNEWVHVAATFDGTFMRTYLNGNVVVEGNFSGTLTTNTNPLEISRSGNGWAHMNGIIDELRIYNRSLTAEEIQAIYNATK